MVNAHHCEKPSENQTGGKNRWPITYPGGIMGYNSWKYGTHTRSTYQHKLKNLILSLKSFAKVLNVIFLLCKE